MDFKKIKIISTMINIYVVIQQICEGILMLSKRCKSRFRPASERRLFPEVCQSEYGNSFFIYPIGHNIFLHLFS